MAKSNVLEDIARRLRGVVKDLEDMFNPQPLPKRAPVPVPVPVRNPQQRRPYTK